LADKHPIVEVDSRAAWRDWLLTNHRQSASIWLVTWKKGDPRHLPYGEIVEEALCFGWVDSLPRKLDDTRSMLLLSPRRPGSAWSRLNKERVERMIAADLMQPAGLRKVDDAKRDGSWNRLDLVETLALPEDLALALAGQPGATENWNAFPRSARRGILEWIDQARKPETRARRVSETAALAARNQRANQWRGPGGTKGT